MQDEMAGKQKKTDTSGKPPKYPLFDYVKQFRSN